MNLENAKIAVIGLGYVGLPLAVEFGKKYDVLGFDINQGRVDELLRGHDTTFEVSDTELATATKLTYSCNKADLADANVYIVTVPTPIDESNAPDLTPLQKASEMLGAVVKKGDVVIYESTVYPGATEEVCLPIVEKVSGLKFNQDFFAGYSPERINPGDKVNTLTKIMKITSGSTPEIADFVDDLYGSIITAGTHKAASLKVAEAAKVIENVQRDVNIALVNELFQIFTKLGIDTTNVIDAAATKWNFMKLYPGLVGGHCISVDPYYLLHKSQKNGYIPDLMRKAREINNSMPEFVANEFLTKIIKNKINPVNLKVAMLGFTFKENCPDIRNTKAVTLYRELINMGIQVTIYDDVANKDEVMTEYNLEIKSLAEISESVAILTVPHADIVNLCEQQEFNYLYDFKGALN